MAFGVECVAHPGQAIVLKQMLSAVSSGSRPSLNSMQLCLEKLTSLFRLGFPMLHAGGTRSDYRYFRN